MSISASPMPSLLDGFASRIRASRAAGTARAYEKVAGAFLRCAARGQPERSDVERFIAIGATGVKNAAPTRNHRLAALRALAKFALAEGRWRQDPTQGIEFHKEPPRDPAVLSAGEVERLFYAVDASSPFDQVVRDRAMLALLFTLGLRVHELVLLNVHQVDFASSTFVGVRGKGNTVHDLPLVKGALEPLRSWLLERSQHAHPDDPALFVSRRGTRLSTRSVQRLFLRLRLATGTMKKVTPHTARHSVATLALLGGADISSIGELLRHADINVTRRYVRLVDTRKRQVAELVARVIPASTDSSQTTSSPAAAASPRRRAMLAEPIGLDTVQVVQLRPANDVGAIVLDGKDDFCDVQSQMSWATYPQPSRIRSPKEMSAWQRERDRVSRVFHRCSRQCDAIALAARASCIGSSRQREWMPCT
jgi:site-specific recombinase XerD